MQDHNNLSWLHLSLLGFVFIMAVLKLFGWIGGVYLLLLASLLFGVFNKKYRKFVGTILGGVLLISLIYILLMKSQSLAAFLRSTRAISAVGLWLTSIGFIGKSRLEKWERNAKNLLQHNNIDGKAELFNEKGRNIAWRGFLIGVPIILFGVLPILFVILTILSVSPELVTYILVGTLLAPLILFFLYGLLWPFIGYVMRVGHDCTP